ncbi:MAG: hypothetical protein ACT4P9_04195 [Betaproteobacteria bacterium]
MKQTIALTIAAAALLTLAWMFRYEVTGHLEPNPLFKIDASGNLVLADMRARPIMLDRWTGKTYFYYVTVSETRVSGDWQEMGGFAIKPK